jgi:two-component system cell cycle sensor histidine kinase/response regulator CckA
VSSPSLPPASIETILLVEDEPPVRRLARRTLHKNGFTVLEAGNGREALAVVEEHGGMVHLLVTDVMMPEMGGRELAERLITVYPGLRVLFVSGYTEDGDVRQGGRDGWHFLAKPFTQASLARKVREVLDG